MDDLQSTNGKFRGAAAYARSKRVQGILSELWASRLEGTGVVVNAMHPGWVDTPGLRYSLPGFHRLLQRWLRTPEEGPDTIVWLGSAPQAADASGGFWLDRARRPTHLLPWTGESEAERRRLWDEIVALLILGPKRLPEAGRALGQGLKEFKSSIRPTHDDDPQVRSKQPPALSARAVLIRPASASAARGRPRRRQRTCLGRAVSAARRRM